MDSFDPGYDRFASGPLWDPKFLLIALGLAVALAVCGAAVGWTMAQQDERKRRYASLENHWKALWQRGYWAGAAPGSSVLHQADLLAQEIEKRLGPIAAFGGPLAKVLKDLCKQYQAVIKKATKKPFPQKPREQLRGAVEAVFSSWNGARAIAYRVRERISHDLGTAVNVQTMVFGNRDDNSGTGVGFTRNAATGENRPYGDFLINAQGEDVVAGIRNTEDLDHMKLHFPAIHKELIDIFDRLEAHYQDMCDTEFTIEQGKLWMLQTRVGKRTEIGRAHV